MTSVGHATFSIKCNMVASNGRIGPVSWCIDRLITCSARPDFQLEYLGFNDRLKAPCRHSPDSLNEVASFVVRKLPTVSGLRFDQGD